MSLSPSGISTISGIRFTPDACVVLIKTNWNHSITDALEAGALLKLQEAGVKIPDDIAVAGFNNEPISQVIRPNLTTVDYPAREIGEIAATALIDKLNNSQSINYSTIVLKHSLIIRQSSLRGK